MEQFTILCLRYTVVAQTPIEFGFQAGAQLRGGLYSALMEMMHQPGVHDLDPAHTVYCPVCRMMKRENPDTGRGQDVPRPFGLIPPGIERPERSFQANTGERFSFGLNLYGDTALNYTLFTLAVSRLGQMGVGFGRGRFLLTAIEALNPFIGQAECLMSDSGHSRMPTLTVTAEHVRQYATTLPDSQLTLQFLTPTRLVDHGQLVKTPQFRPLMARLLERLEGLEREYAEGISWKERYLTLTQAAHHIQVINDKTQWVEVQSGSRRLGRLTPISGFEGKTTYIGNMTLFKEWLAWGALLQVGKSVVKGNGVYQIVL
jgi:CRISPR-associated endoribonuclease Cas6